MSMRGKRALQVLEGVNTSGCLGRFGYEMYPSAFLEKEDVGPLGEGLTIFEALGHRADLSQKEGELFTNFA